ncbi:MAG: tRNA uridine-5-carboxymethylaminomethyl(34) synthesis GTPase MnmE [Lachnospiraceae bacterium]|nr:tRNA uridine-5-carboxymethylaminomethyl(34) synthesis GTPase MnmE [Lachnospiraceae bacterium]
MNTDTIAAIATALSDSGIGIIRISGPEAIEIADKVYRSKGGNKHLKNVESHTIHYGFIVDKNDSIIDSMDNEIILDEVMVSVMKAPKSYTAEDTVEINCHGGVLMMRRILETVLKAGARMAEPGEFSKRAFLNGRMDLSEAEAVMDVIHAKNELALKSSISQLKGAVSEKIKELRAKIIYEIAFIESALDDPEHITLEEYPERLTAIVEGLLLEVNKLLSSADNGKILKEGINTVIVGKPNAGKSSFLNLLIGEEKAIVTDIAGTTRDILEEQIRLNGISLNMIDTAGIRSTEDVVEKIGVEKAKKYAEDADLVIYVVDSSVPLDENDKEIMELIGSKKCVVLLNKTDLEPVITEKILMEAFVEINPENVITIKDFLCEDNLSENETSNKIKVIKTSTKDATGMDTFEETVKEMFFSGEISFENEVYITNIRHKEALNETKNALTMVKQSLEDNMPEDFYSIDLMSAYASLGSIIGEEISDDLVEEIFSKFCMGK